MKQARVAVLASVLLAACGAPAHAPRPPAAAALPPLEGFWLSEGYGWQLEVTPEGELARSQVTSISCIPNWRAALVSRDASSATFRRMDRPVTLHFAATSSNDRLRLHVAGAASDVFFHRLPGRLPFCDRPTPDTPRENLEVFAETFAEHYPFFALHHVDWPAVVARARTPVDDRTSQRQLFDVLRGMLEPLHDAQTSIDAKTLDGGVGWAGLRTPEGTLDGDEDFARAAKVADGYLVSPPRTFCNGRIEAGTLRGGVAYLRITAFAGYDESGAFESGLALLESALDEIFGGASNWPALVIDVRVNFGGYDPYGEAVAARLAQGEYVAFEQQARDDPRDATHWTVPQVTRVHPRAPGYRGPVVLLTGPNTISAGETFTMALMGRTPAIARIGQSTQGVFSDVMERILPNGWSFGLPSERYVTAGRSYDGEGVPPTIEVPVFRRADMDAGRDLAIEAALRELGVRAP